MEIRQEETTTAASRQRSRSRLSKSTLYMIADHAYNLSKLIAALVTRPGVVLALGPALHDLIDLAVGELRYFVESKPARDPALVKPADFDKSVKDNNTLVGCGLEYEQHCSHAMQSMSILFAILDEKIIDKLPADVFLKLIHPDTKYIIALVDIVLTRPACYAKRKYGFVKWNPNTTPGRNRRGRILLDSLEACSWSLIDSVFIYDAPKFPVAATFQMAQECYDKVMLLRPLLRKERLLKAMPVLKELQKFLNQLASTPPKLVANQQLPEAEADAGTSWTPIPPSPTFVSIRAQLDLNGDAIIRIHTSMGTFEEDGLTDACRRITRDNYNYCLFPLCDMNNCCFYCVKTDAKLRCSRCRYAHYCNKKCQSKDWGTHKLICSR